MECYVFVDDSNLWIKGQKAQGEKLKDADIDKRYRVDLGKLLHLVSKKRNIFKAYLYGSTPPPNDTVWKAARKKNFEVKIFERSGSGREGARYCNGDGYDKKPLHFEPQRRRDIHCCNRGSRS